MLTIEQYMELQFEIKIRKHRTRSFPENFHTTLMRRKYQEYMEYSTDNIPAVRITAWSISISLSKILPKLNPALP